MINFFKKLFSRKRPQIRFELADNGDIFIFCDWKKLKNDPLSIRKFIEQYVKLILIIDSGNLDNAVKEAIMIKGHYAGKLDSEAARIIVNILEKNHDNINDPAMNPSQVF